MISEKLGILFRILSLSSRNFWSLKSVVLGEPRLVSKKLSLPNTASMLERIVALAMRMFDVDWLLRPLLFLIELLRGKAFLRLIRLCMV